jgi:hypothetical protein
MTIWLGANDAAYGFLNVPQEQYIANVLSFTRQFLDHPNCAKTKILLITTPPINFRPSQTEDDYEDPYFTTYVQKMLYSEALVKAPKEFEGDRVQVLNIWRVLVNTALDASGKAELKADLKLDSDLVAEEKLPGCGLQGSEKFPEGFFVDGLHFDDLVGSDVLFDKH